MESHLRQLKRAFIALFFGMLFLVPIFATPALAANSFEVSPKVLTVKVKPREINNLMLTFKNKNPAITTVYVKMLDVDPALGKVSNGSNTPNDSTPSHWIEMSRSNDLLPKEEQSIPLRVSVPAQAKSGIYNVVVRLSSDSSMSSSCTACSEEVQLNIDVADDAREVMQLSSFLTTKDIFTGDSADFNLRVSNTGNRALAPAGKIRIFDKRGNEVGAVDVNSGGKTIDPKAEDMLAASWAAGSHFGRYKALLDVNYGQRGIMQDTVYFWVIPWARLSGLFMTIMLVVGFAIIMIRGRGMAGAYAYADGAEYHDAAYDEPFVEPTPASIRRARIRMEPTSLKQQAREEYREPTYHDVVPQASVRTAPVGAVSLSARDQRFVGGGVSIAPRSKPDMRDHQVALGRPEKFVAPEHQIRL
jgi:hypothetical protein